MKWQAVITALVVSGFAFAQSPPAPPGGTESKNKTKTSKPATKKKVDRQAKKMRRGITRGRQVKSHVKVKVRLNNGNKLTGVVKDGRLVERVDGLRFVDAQAADRGAGIRLWYSGGTRNYVFVPFRDLKNYEVLQRLSHKQLMEIEHDLQMSEKRAAERAAERARQAKGKAEAGPKANGKPETLDENGKPKTGDVPGGEQAKAGDVAKEKQAEAAKSLQQTREKRLADLLAKYPPGDGWNEAKRNEISRRRVVIGAVPSKDEMAFVEQFDDWIEACEAAGVDPNAGVVEKPKTKRDRRKAERARTRGR